MDDPAMGKGRAFRMDAVHSEAEAQTILEGSATKDPSLEQVREILFGAESRRAESARRALESEVGDRFGRLEAEYSQHTELSARLEQAAQALGAQKTSRDELASLLDEVADRLRAASGG
jgi:hypothetical protein